MTITHDHHVLNAMRNAISYRIHEVFGNPANMSRAEQHEHQCLLEADQNLAKVRDGFMSNATDEDSYPKVLVGGGGKTRKVDNAEDEAQARLDGLNYPPPYEPPAKPVELVEPIPAVEAKAPATAAKPVVVAAAPAPPAPAPAPPAPAPVVK